MNRGFTFGQWTGKASWTAESIHALCDEAERRATDFSQVPLEEIFDLFDLLKSKWQDPEYKWRKQAQNGLPLRTRFSPAMIRLALDHLGGLFDSAALQKKLDTELRNIPRQGVPKFDLDKRNYLKWNPLGTILHVLAGNVFLVGPGALVQGAITGNLTLLKMSSEETYFLPLFVESLLECEQELGRGPLLSQSLSLLQYSSRQTDVIGALKSRIDGIAIWGGETAVQAYRNDLPARVRSIVFGPKLSFAYLSAAGIQERGLQESANSLAQQISIWDQSACTAPQVCYVEGKDLAQKLAEELGQALQKIQQTRPQCDLTDNESAEIRKFLSVYEIEEAMGLAEIQSGQNLEWNVILDSKTTLATTPLHRTIRVIAIEEDRVVEEQTALLKNYVQTVGVVATAREHVDLSYRLGRAGALRVVSLEEMSGGHLDDPHDGAFDLPQFLNLTVTQVNNYDDGQRFFEMLPINEQEKALSQRWHQTRRRIFQAPFYRQLMDQNPSLKNSSLEKWSILSKKALTEQMPPKSSGLATHGNIHGGHVTRSGGSTGESKYSWFDKKDWQKMVESGAEVFIACGFDKADRMANTFLAGDLYGSFISFSDVNALIGMTSFPFAGKISEESFLEVQKQFGINAIQGVPSSMMPLLRRCKEVDASFRIEKVMYAGEPMSNADRNWLESECQTTVIASIIGTTEAGAIAYQTSKDSGNLYRTLPEYNFLEVVNDQGQRLPNGEIGKILVTTLNKESFPLIRYDIGDQGRWIETAEGRRLEYLGRHDEIVCISQMNLSYNDLAEAFEKLPISDFQLQATFKDSEDFLSIHVETQNWQDSDLSKKVEEQLHSIPSIQEKSEKQIFKYDIHLHNLGELPRQERTGKLKRIKDLRQ